MSRLIRGPIFEFWLSRVGLGRAVEVGQLLMVAPVQTRDISVIGSVCFILSPVSSYLQSPFAPNCI